ncbi:MAG: ATP-binding cassette domain-containing protein [Erysipelotrichaceae bacterium]|nr:ATP-binding cassette domain-containing protein [Erysipelotrichaceae bacterium]MDD3808942.1 ATP-binding cassette domain-containing protein [Erysipelotrichaceae bacterium]
MPSIKLISLDQVGFAYGDFQIFADVSLDIVKGNIIGLYGENGCGKSTLLKLILGELKPQQGKITSQEKVKISFLGQNDRDMINGTPLNVEELVLMYHINSIKHMAKSRHNRHVGHLLEDFQLSHIAKSKLNQLSGGQLQRVMIVKTLSTHPDLILLDEPLNQLDEKTQEEMMELILQLKKLGKTIVIILHNKKQLEAIADEIYIFKDKKIFLSEVL